MSAAISVAATARNQYVRRGRNELRTIFETARANRSETTQGVLPDFTILPYCQPETTGDADVSIRMAALVNTRLRPYRLRAILPQIFGPMDAAACDEISAMGEWVHLGRGVALSAGRIRPNAVHCRQRQAVRSGDGRRRPAAELRSDTDVIPFTPDVFGSITSRYPHVVMAISTIVIRRLQRSEILQRCLGVPSPVDRAGP